MRLLDVRNLSVELITRRGVVRALDKLSFWVDDAETVGLVGESGCGKSMTCRAILRLLPEPAGRVTGGEIYYKGTNLLALGNAEMRSLRGSEISMILQDPGTSLNPSLTIASQLGEPMHYHGGLKGRSLRNRSLDLLRQVRIPGAERVLRSYPHELSGGMRQRVVGATAISNTPRLLLADEPTTNLDATTQNQYLDLLVQMRQDTAVSMIFVTHDFGIVAKVCDRIAVMYAGTIVEQGSKIDVMEEPAHPYTSGLLASMPPLTRFTGKLQTIPGEPPGLDNKPTGCPFAPRCPKARQQCTDVEPPEIQVSHDHYTRCWYPNGREGL